MQHGSRFKIDDLVSYPKIRTRIACDISDNVFVRITINTKLLDYSRE